jgi:hypothetical protein
MIDCRYFEPRFYIREGSRKQRNMMRARGRRHDFIAGAVIRRFLDIAIQRTLEQGAYVRVVADYWLMILAFRACHMLGPE